MHLYAERQTRPGFAYAVDHEWLERLEEDFPYRETEDQRTAIEAVKEDLEAPRPDGQARLRRRRFRQDRGRAARRVRRRRQRQAGADARPDDGARAAALEHVPRALSRLPGARRDGVPLPQAGRGQEGAGRVHRRQGRDPDRDAPRARPRRRAEGARARDRRRGAALRRRAEGAAPAAAPRGGRALTVGDADSTHAAHVARRPPRHLRDRDAAGGTPADPHLRRRVRRGARSRARSSARSRETGRRSTSTIASRPSTPPPSASGSSARSSGSSSATARWPSASSRIRC